MKNFVVFLIIISTFSLCFVNLQARHPDDGVLGALKDLLSGPNRWHGDGGLLGGLGDLLHGGDHHHHHHHYHDDCVCDWD